MNPLFVLCFSTRCVQNFHLAAPRFLAGADCVWRLLEFVSLQLAKDCYWDKSNRSTSGFRVLVSFRSFSFLFRTRYVLHVQPYAQRPRLVNKHIHHPLFEYEEKHFCLLVFCEAKQKIEIDSFSLFELDKGLVFKFLILILSTQISFFFSTHSMKLNDQKIHWLRTLIRCHYFKLTDLIVLNLSLKHLDQKALNIKLYQNQKGYQLLHTVVNWY